MDRRLKGLLAATTAVAAVGVAGVTDVAGADDHPAQEMRPMHEERQDGRHTHVGAGQHRRDMDDVHARTSRQLPPEDRDLHDRMHESCAGHTDERIAT